MRDELPEGWALSSVGECFLDIRNGTIAKQNKEGIGVPVSRIETIQEMRFDLTRVGFIGDTGEALLENFQYKPGDIAFSHINSLEHVGKTAVYDGTPPVFLHGMNLLRLRLGHTELRPDFLHLYMQSEEFREAVRERSTHAVNQVSINKKNLGAIPIPLAPLAEQRRIVARVEAVLDQVTRVKSRLAKVQAILKRFRRAVLGAACSGRLTEDWRARQSGGSTESAIETSCGDQAEGTLEYLELPETWRVVKFQQVVKDSFYGPRFAANSYTEDGVPTVRTTDMDLRGNITLKGAPTVQLSAKELRKYALLDGDVLVTRTGTIGKCAVYRKTLGPAIPSAYLIRFRLDKASVLPEYAFLFLQSPVGQQLLGIGQTSVTQPNVNAKTIGDFPFPLASIAEQAEIVRRVGVLLGPTDEIEKRLVAAGERIITLPQSVLSKAFSGELVPTEAQVARAEGRDYESADVLLERIRKDRANFIARRKSPRAEFTKGPRGGRSAALDR